MNRNFTENHDIVLAALPRLSNEQQELVGYYIDHFLRLHNLNIDTISSTESDYETANKGVNSTLKRFERELSDLKHEKKQFIANPSSRLAELRARYDDRATVKNDFHLKENEIYRLNRLISDAACLLDDKKKFVELLKKTEDYVLVKYGEYSSQGRINPEQFHLELSARYILPLKIATENAAIKSDVLKAERIKNALEFEKLLLNVKSLSNRSSNFGFNRIVLRSVCELYISYYREKHNYSDPAEYDSLKLDAEFKRTNDDLVQRHLEMVTAMNEADNAVSHVPLGLTAAEEALFHVEQLKKVKKLKIRLKHAEDELRLLNKAEAYVLIKFGDPDLFAEISAYEKTQRLVDAYSARTHLTELGVLENDSTRILAQNITRMFELKIHDLEIRASKSGATGIRAREILDACRLIITNRIIESRTGATSSVEDLKKISDCYEILRQREMELISAISEARHDLAFFESDTVFDWIRGNKSQLETLELLNPFFGSMREEDILEALKDNTLKSVQTFQDALTLVTGDIHLLNNAEDYANQRYKLEPEREVESIRYISPLRNTNVEVISIKSPAQKI